MDGRRLEQFGGGIAIVRLDRLRSGRAGRRILQFHPTRRAARWSGAAQLLARVRWRYTSARQSGPQSFPRFLIHCERRESPQPAARRAGRHPRCPRKNTKFWTPRSHVTGKKTTEDSPLGALGFTARGFGLTHHATRISPQPPAAPPKAP